MARSCVHHCERCGSHFADTMAFNAHVGYDGVDMYCDLGALADEYEFALDDGFHKSINKKPKPCSIWRKRIWPAGHVPHVTRADLVLTFYKGHWVKKTD